MKLWHGASSAMIIIAIVSLAVTITIIAQALYNTGFYRPVPGGVMITAGDFYGTSSYVVEDETTGTRYLLIAYHVAYYGGTDEIYQPTTSSSYYYIGNVVRYNDYVDAALVAANDELGVSFDPRIRLPDGTYITLSSVVSWNELQGYLGREVNLIGVTSGYKASRLIGFEAVYDYKDQFGKIGELRYVVFLESNITDFGDSGAPAWMPSWGGNELLGHVVGVGEYGGANRTVIVSASVLEEYLGVIPVTGG